MIRRRAAWLAALWLVGCLVHAEDYDARWKTRFPIPAEYRLVNDYAEILRISQRAAIEKRLQELERRNGTQIVFLSVRNTGSQSAWEYSGEVFQKWNIGNNGEHNGVLLMIGQDGPAIRTGGQIAGAVPDVMAARIQRDILLPSYQKNRLDEGVELALDALIKASAAETTQATAYDYRRNMELLAGALPRPEERWIAGLSIAAGVYAGALLWRRLRRGKSA